MSQQINLFNPLFRRKGFSFTSATAMLYGVGIAAAAGAMGAGYAQYELREAGVQAQALEREYKEATARFEKLAAEVAQQKPNPQIEAEISSLDSHLKGRQEIIETLKSGGLGNTSGFSEYMRAFSRQNVNGLWITAFDIARGGNELAIQGRTLNADLVAVYLKQLNQEKPLQGRQFAALRIGQPAPDTVEQAKGSAETNPPAPVQNGKESAAPRYLDFTISSGALPEDPKQTAKTTSTPAPLLGVVDPNTVLDKKPAPGQDTPR